MTCFVVNLDRDKERLETTRSMFSEAGMDFERICGVDARAMTAAELHEEGALSLSIPFSCGADAAKIKLMAVDNQYKPLIKAVTVAG